MTSKKSKGTGNMTDWYRGWPVFGDKKSAKKSKEQIAREKEVAAMKKRASSLDPRTLDLTRTQKDFIELTKYTCPNGHERMYDSRMRSLGFHMDDHGNWFKMVGKEAPHVMFTCHLDTADYGKGAKPRKVHHVFSKKNGAITVETDGTSLLGADDKAGMAIMLKMIRNNVRGLYYIFQGEEVGRIGSELLANEWAETGGPGIKVCVSFDRFGYESVISHQSGQRCASPEFVQALADGLNGMDYGMFESDNGGSYTDSYSFINIIPECTNVSVGYQGAHTHRESQDLSFLDWIAQRCCEVDWHALPVVRDPIGEEIDLSELDAWEELGYCTCEEDIAEWCHENYLLVPSLLDQVRGFSSRCTLLDVIGNISMDMVAQIEGEMYRGFTSSFKSLGGSSNYADLSQIAEDPVVTFIKELSVEGTIEEDAEE